MRTSARTGLLALLLTGCAGVGTYRRTTVDPVVVVHGPAFDELAVSTSYGIVFLGRGAKSGRVEFSAWFADGENREEGVIEPVGGGLFATNAEILLPAVALAYEVPAPGTVVLVRGRRAGHPFEFEARIAREPRVSGILLEASRELDALEDAELGSGVFLNEPGRPLELLGLVSGRLELDGHRYVTAVGPEDLWRLVVHRRNSDRPRRWVYREDIL